MIIKKKNIRTIVITCALLGLSLIHILKKGQTSPDFADKISIAGDIATIVDQTSQTDDNGLTTITTTYEYDLSLIHI